MHRCVLQTRNGMCMKNENLSFDCAVCLRVSLILIEYLVLFANWMKSINCGVCQLLQYKWQTQIWIMFWRISWWVNSYGQSDNKRENERKYWIKQFEYEKLLWTISIILLINFTLNYLLQLFAQIHSVAVPRITRYARTICFDNEPQSVEVNKQPTLT